MKRVENWILKSIRRPYIRLSRIENMTTFNNMVFRLVNILMNITDFVKDLEVIKEIAKFNGYNDNMIKISPKTKMG